MSLFGNQRIDTMKDTVSNTSIDEGLPRELSQLSLTVSATSQDETYSYKGHPEFTLRHMYGYFQSKQLCDVVLLCGSVRIQAHKLVLVACSEYFAAMFTGNLKESQQEEVTLERIDPNALQSLVQYCYTGAIELREESVESLLSTSCLLQLHAVTSACCAFLRRQLDPCNCLGIALFAEQQACNALHKQATDYTCQHYMQVCKNQEFLQLEPSQLSILLRSEELNVPSEEAVFESLMTWVAHEPARERHLAELMALVKLPLLTPEYILGNVEHACSSVQECRPLIMEAVSWHLLPERRNKVCSARTRPRTSTIGRLLAVGGMDSYKGGSNMELYDPRTNTWAQFVRLGARRLQFGVAVVQDKLVVVGGRDGLKTLNTVECFDLSCLTWSAMPPMATHRHGLGVAVLGAGPGAPLYAVGGHDGWSYLNTVERWDPIARAWSTVAPMSFARSTCGVGVLDGRVYAVGGRDGGACLRTAECYRPDTNRWTQCAPMNRRRGGVSVSVASGYLYALGGHDAPAGNPGGGRLSCVERYDPVTDCWTIVASLCCARDSIGSTVLGDRVVAVGGYDGSQYLCIVEMYDAHNNEWRTLASLNSGRAGACVVPVPTHTTLQPAPSAPGTD